MKQCQLAVLSALVVVAGMTLWSVRANARDQDIPKELFGITVGASYVMGNPDAGDLGTFPVKKFAGIQRFMGSGISYYFEPLKAPKDFEYVEERKNPGDKYYTTSFRAYIYPVLPKGIGSMKELQDVWPKLKQKVSLIEWQKKLKGDDAYYRAIDMCKTFEAAFALKPKKTDLDKWFTCTFAAADRKFEVRSSGDLLSVSLSIPDAARDKLDKSVDEYIRRLKAKDMLQ